MKQSDANEVDKGQDDRYKIIPKGSQRGKDVLFDCKEGHCFTKDRVRGTTEYWKCECRPRSNCKVDVLDTPNCKVGVARTPTGCKQKQPQHCGEHKPKMFQVIQQIIKSDEDTIEKLAAVYCKENRGMDLLKKKSILLLQYHQLPVSSNIHSGSQTETHSPIPETVSPDNQKEPKNSDPCTDMNLRGQSNHQALTENQMSSTKEAQKQIAAEQFQKTTHDGASTSKTLPSEIGPVSADQPNLKMDVTSDSPEVVDQSNAPLPNSSMTFIQQLQPEPKNEAEVPGEQKSIAETQIAASEPNQKVVMCETDHPEKDQDVIHRNKANVLNGLDGARSEDLSQMYPDLDDQTQYNENFLHDVRAVFVDDPSQGQSKYQGLTENQMSSTNKAQKHIAAEQIKKTTHDGSSSSKTLPPEIGPGSADQPNLKMDVTADSPEVVDQSNAPLPNSSMTSIQQLQPESNDEAEVPVEQRSLPETQISASEPNERVGVCGTDDSEKDQDVIYCKGKNTANNHDDDAEFDKMRNLPRGTWDVVVGENWIQNELNKAFDEASNIGDIDTEILELIWETTAPDQMTTSKTSATVPTSFQVSAPVTYKVASTQNKKAQKHQNKTNEETHRMFPWVIEQTNEEQSCSMMDVVDVEADSTENVEQLYGAHPHSTMPSSSMQQFQSVPEKAEVPGEQSSVAETQMTVLQPWGPDAQACHLTQQGYVNAPTPANLGEKSQEDHSVHGPRPVNNNDVASVPQTNEIEEPATSTETVSQGDVVVKSTQREKKLSKSQNYKEAMTVCKRICDIMSEQSMEKFCCQFAQLLKLDNELEMDVLTQENSNSRDSQECTVPLDVPLDLRTPQDPKTDTARETPEIDRPNELPELSDDIMDEMPEAVPEAAPEVVEPSENCAETLSAKRRSQDDDDIQASPKRVKLEDIKLPTKSRVHGHQKGSDLTPCGRWQDILELPSFVENIKVIGVEVPTEKISSGGITLDQSDFNCLDDGAWVNDNIVHAYLNILARESEKKVHILPCFLMQLCEQGKYDKWLYSKTNLADFDLILLPTNYKGQHWLLVVADLENREVYVVDSKKDPTRSENYLKHWSKYVATRNFEVRDKLPDLKHVTQQTPQQSDGSSCGIFVMMYAEYLCTAAAEVGQQCHVSSFRQYVKARLIHHSKTDN